MQNECNPDGDETVAESRFLIGDTVRFAERHIAAGDTGVIVARECWINNNKAVAWNGVGKIPARVHHRFDYSIPPDRLGRYLVRLLSVNESSNPTIGGLASWRERCAQSPHDYPYCYAIDLELVSRPEIKVLNNSGYLGSAMGLDPTTSACCISDSEAGVRLRMAEMKASRGVPLNVADTPNPDGKIRFSVQEIRETKVADEIQVGFEFWVSTVFGMPARVAVTEIKGADTAYYKVVSGGLAGLLKRHEDGWYDQHILYNLEGVMRAKFV